MYLLVTTVGHLVGFRLSYLLAIWNQLWSLISLRSVVCICKVDKNRIFSTEQNEIIFVKDGAQRLRVQRYKNGFYNKFLSDLTMPQKKATILHVKFMV